MASRSVVVEIWRFFVYRGVEDNVADISRLDCPIGVIPFPPCFPRCPQPSPTVSYRLPWWLSLGTLVFPPVSLPHGLSSLYLPQSFAAPLDFFGYNTTRSELSNGVLHVWVRAVVVEISGFLWVGVSLASFADISGRGARIWSVVFSTCCPQFPLLFPSVSCRVYQQLSFEDFPFSPSPLLAPSSSCCQFATEDG
ncbi:hypothetical protein EDD16DRAFT_1196073 [Pisolithus croceorrhizus]|nr:hypothetical protein EDD16DRAFT_1196073 [Pisolithus croceorrhizus]